MKRVRLASPATLTAQEVADRLGITLLTVYRWRASHKLPARAADNTDKHAQKYVFDERDVAEWLRSRRPELLLAWNGQSALIRKPNSWTRRRLMRAMRTEMAA